MAAWSTDEPAVQTDTPVLPRKIDKGERGEVTRRKEEPARRGGGVVRACERASERTSEHGMQAQNKAISKGVKQHTYTLRVLKLKKCVYMGRRETSERRNAKKKQMVEESVRLLIAAMLEAAAEQLLRTAEMYGSSRAEPADVEGRPGRSWEVAKTPAA